MFRFHKRRIVKPCPIRFVDVYNDIFKKRRCTNLTVCRDTRTKLWTSYYILKIFKTQHIRKLLNAHDMEIAKKTFRLASLETRLKIRTLQHHIIKYLWRPGGRLMERELHKFHGFVSNDPHELRLSRGLPHSFKEITDPSFGDEHSSCCCGKS